MSKKAAIRLLLIEDDAEDAYLLGEMLKGQTSYRTDLTHVAGMSEAERHLADHSVDIILLDPGLRDAQGVESVRRALAAAPHVPLVVMTSQYDESLATLALQEGAQDFLVKGQVEPRGLLRSLHYAVERKFMEEALFAEKERAQVTLNSIGDAVICSDISGDLTFLNLVAEKMTGWSWQEAAGRPMAEVLRIMDATTRKTIANPMDAAVDGDQPVHLPSNSVLIRRDGLEIPIEDSVAPIHDHDGQATGAVIVFRDVSAARAMSVEMRAVTEELERSNIELQDFAAIASHDLQEPLRKIRAFGDRLAERTSGALDEEAEDYLERMKNAAGRMQSLIDDLLEYSQVTLRPEPARQVDLGGVVSDVLSDLDERIRLSNGRVEVGPLPTILASPFQMRQLFQNLIANALKFHQPGVAPEVQIEATARTRGTGTKGGTPPNSRMGDPCPRQRHWLRGEAW